MRVACMRTIRNVYISTVDDVGVTRGMRGPTLGCRDNVKLILSGCGLGVSTGLIWLRILSVAGYLSYDDSERAGCIKRRIIT
jgi:hypothetical protein